MLGKMKSESNDDANSKNQETNTNPFLDSNNEKSTLSTALVLLSSLVLMHHPKPRGISAIKTTWQAEITEAPKVYGTT